MRKRLISIGYAKQEQDPAHAYATCAYSCAAIKTGLSIIKKHSLDR